MAEKKKNGLGVMMNVVGSWIALLLLLTILAAGPTEAAAESFNVETGTASQYSDVLRDIRKELKDPKLKYGGTDVPVIRAPTSPPRYLHVDLVLGSRKITIALNKNDLYLVGYLETGGGATERAQVFKDAPTNAETQAFPGKVRATRLSYAGSYGGIEGATGVDKTAVPLARQPLQNQFGKVHGKPVNKKEQGRFVLTVIHMFCEAARFSYLETKIVQDFQKASDPFYKLDAKAESLELEWGKISTGIKNSVSGKISPELTDLINEDGSPRTVSQVSEIVGDMALLKHVKDRRLSDDDEHDDHGGTSTTDDDLMMKLASFII